MNDCPYFHPVHASDGAFLWNWCLWSWTRANCAKGCGAMYYRKANRAPTRPTDGPEFVCLSCQLPECDETSPGCLYRPDEEPPDDAPMCPHPACGQTISPRATTCGRHKWYR